MKMTISFPDFRGLETGTGGFSKPWKKTVEILPCLGQDAAEFSRLWRDKPKAWN
jgi:hypothetical protein